MKKHDPVNHPRHYVSHPSGREVIELTRLLDFNTGNAIKYVLRRDSKGDPLENILKAQWYINDAREHNLTFKITRPMQILALEFIYAEHSATVGSIISALCYRGIDNGWFTAREPDLDLASELLTALLGEYV